MSDKKIFSYGGIFRTKKTFFLISRGMKPITRYRIYFSDFLPIKSFEYFIIVTLKTFYQ